MPALAPLQCKKATKKNPVIIRIVLFLLIPKLGDLRYRVSSTHTSNMVGGAIVAARRTATDIISGWQKWASPHRHRCRRPGNLPAKKSEQSFSG